MFGKQKNDQTPQEALDNASNTLNKGLTGKLTKGFMGADFQNKMNSAIDQGQAAIDSSSMAAWIDTTGVDAKATVISITDTGGSVNDQPMVVLQLKVTPDFGMAFDTAGQCVVPRIAVPRVGDEIKIKYNSANTSQFAVQ